MDRNPSPRQNRRSVLLLFYLSSCLYIALAEKKNCAAIQRPMRKSSAHVTDTLAMGSGDSVTIVDAIVCLSSGVSSFLNRTCCIAQATEYRSLW